MTKAFGRLGDWVDHWIFDSLVLALGYLNVGLGFAARLFDDYVIHPVFKGISAEVKKSGQQMTRLQNGRLYARVELI